MYAIVLASLVALALPLAAVDAGAQIASGTVPDSGAPWAEIHLAGADQVAQGERVEVRFRASPGAAVAVIRVDGRGRLRVLVPESPARAAQDSLAGALVGERQTSFVADEERGVGYLFAIASAAPFDFRGYSDGFTWDPRRLTELESDDPLQTATDFARGVLEAEGTPYAIAHTAYSVAEIAAGRYAGEVVVDHWATWLTPFGFSVLDHGCGYGYRPGVLFDGIGSYRCGRHRSWPYGYGYGWAQPSCGSPSMPSCGPRPPGPPPVDRRRRKARDWPVPQDTNGGGGVERAVSMGGQPVAPRRGWDRAAGGVRVYRGDLPHAAPVPAPPPHVAGRTRRSEPSRDWRGAERRPGATPARETRSPAAERPVRSPASSPPPRATAGSVRSAPVRSAPVRVERRPATAARPRSR